MFDHEVHHFGSHRAFVFNHVVHRGEPRVYFRFSPYPAEGASLTRDEALIP